MKTKLIFNTKSLIEKLNSSEEFYEVKENKNSLAVTKRYKDKKGRPFSAILPKKIKISSEALGLIVGEGFIGDRRFVFANSGEKAVKEILAFLKQFRLQIWNYLELSVKNNRNIKDFVRRSQEFWENHLNIKIKKIRIRKDFKNITKYGTIHLMMNSSLVSKLLKQLINISKKEVEKNKDISIGYLRGIIAAEGNINIKKTTKCVYMVRISASKKEERDHYKKCLEKAGLKIYCQDMQTVSKEEGKQRGWKTDKGRAGAVIISRWENFVKLFELNLFELNKEKKSKFLKYFFNNKFTKQFLDFQHFLNKEFTMKEAQNLFGFSGRYLGRVLTLCKQGYLTRKKINQVKFVYKLTDKYLAFYNKLKREGL